MKISSLSVPKYRDLSSIGDDTILVLPELVGVFDGATSVTEHKAAISPGKLASVAASNAVASMASTGAFTELGLADICEIIRSGIDKDCDAASLKANPATTMAVAAFSDTEVRLIIVGDSGIRVNGMDLYQSLKDVDTVSTNSRVHVFNTLSERHDNRDWIEETTRRVSFLGLDMALSTGVLSKAEVDGAIEAGLSEDRFPTDQEQAIRFLKDGIQSQSRFANNAANHFGYSILNRQETLLRDIIDVRLPRGDIQSLELYSDGYFSFPKTGTTITDWENAFFAAEEADFSKTCAYKSVKGSTSKEFSDDRSLIVVDCPN